MWSYAEWLAGNWREAASLAAEGHECALQAGQRSWQAFMLGTTALLAASCGREQDARRHAEAGLALAEATGNQLAALLSLSSLGLLELSLGAHDATHQHLEPLARHCEEAGLREPTVARFLVDEIEALIGLGRLDEGKELLERFEGCARALDRASALASAARCRGLLAAARGDFAGAESALERALREHERVRQPFDHGRTLLAMGQVRRRMKQKRAARESLEAALTIFDELGATLWAARARAELARIGGRTPASGELTPSELRVAELVVDGCSNKKVAAALVISPLTVEGHLKQIYRKLGIHSRTQLRREHLEAERTNA
jgi:DNA-binding CsgD family transcriptional regulator